MSDFLSNLVARTIAQPTLRPRGRSRFEASAIEEAPLVWPEASSRAEPDVEPQAVPPASTSTPTPTRPPSERRRPAGGPSGVPPLPEAENASEPRTHAEAPTSAEEKRIAVEHDTQRVIEANERVIRVPVPVAARPHRFEEQPPRIIERNGPREIEERQRQRIIRTTTERTRRVGAKQQRIESTSPAEPVIQVSIGRIEVRAVTSTPSARNAPRNDTMTIDDYVAKRKAKERR